MFFAAGITDKTDPAEAIHSVLAQVQETLQDRPIHAAFLFASAHYRMDWASQLRQIRRTLGSPVLIGCTGGGIVGSNMELEGVPAISLVAACLPRVKLHPFSVSPEDLAEPRDSGYWIEKIGANPSEQPVGVLLPEPYSCDCMTLLDSMRQVYPTMPIVGGLASGARGPGENALFLNDDLIPEGAVGLLMTGDIAMETMVSQGCRPIGRPFIITKAQENVIFELAGMPATEALKQLYSSLTDKDRQLAQRALLIGMVVNEYQQSFGRGDFLIRNLIAMDVASGALAVGDQVQRGQTIQFHVRDADSSREDLGLLLKQQSAAHPRKARGGLLFSCMGRGQELYGEPHYDIKTIQGGLGPFPVGGFFCNGEIGPIAHKNQLHGFTSSLGLFHPRSA